MEIGEQLAWAMQQPHYSVRFPFQPSVDVAKALQDELAADSDALDQERRQLVANWIYRADKMSGRHRRLTLNGSTAVDPRSRLLVSNINVPLGPK